MHKGMGEYIGIPVRRYRSQKVSDWDSVKLDRVYTGHFMICDKHGDGIKWIDVKDGMIIKIRAELNHWEGKEYLESDSQGKY